MDPRSLQTIVARRQQRLASELGGGTGRSDDWSSGGEGKAPAVEFQDNPPGSPLLGGSTRKGAVRSSCSSR